MAETWKRCKLLGNSHAEVFLAADRVTGHLFVVKTTDTEQRRATAELLNEITIYLMLDHSPRIVRYLGSSFTREEGPGGRTKLNLFVEYMPGGTLRSHIARLGAPLGDRLLRTYARSLVEGLHHLHRRGIVHGDVKSENVLVGLYDIKLADFGGSKLVGVEKSMKGTCAWMAPEVVAGAEQGPPSDVWSLGCTVLEMATGLDPWPDIPHARLLRRVIRHSNLTPCVPPALSPDGHRFLSRCLVRDPARRWTTARLLEEDPFLAGLAPLPRPLGGSIARPPDANSRWEDWAFGNGSDSVEENEGGDGKGEYNRCGEEEERPCCSSMPISTTQNERVGRSPPEYDGGGPSWETPMTCHLDEMPAADFQISNFLDDDDSSRPLDAKGETLDAGGETSDAKGEILDAKGEKTLSGEDGREGGSSRCERRVLNLPHCPSWEGVKEWAAELQNLVALGLTTSEWDAVDRILLTAQSKR